MKAMYVIVAGGDNNKCFQNSKTIVSGMYNCTSHWSRSQSWPSFAVTVTATHMFCLFLCVCRLGRCRGLFFANASEEDHSLTESVCP